MSKEYLGEWNGVPVYTDFLPYGTRRTGQSLDTGSPILRYIMTQVILEVQHNKTLTIIKYL